MTKKAAESLFLAFIVVLGVFMVVRSVNHTHHDSRAHEHEDMVEEVHYHAGFQVYIDNKLQDFAKLKYMSIKPCGIEEHEHDHDSGDLRDALHLHDMIGDVVHVHAANMTWQNFFDSLSYALPDDGVIYVNGQEQTDVLGRIIEENESVIFSYNTTIDENILDQAVPIEKIIDVGMASENCST